MGHLFLLAGIALASPGGLGPSHPSVGKAIFGHDTLWNAYLRAYEPETLPADGLPELMCRTALVNALKQEWDEFTPTERAEITSHVAPFLTDLLAPMPRKAPVTLPDGQLPPPGKDVCWGDVMGQQIHSSHFSVEWNNGVVDTSTAQALSDKLEFDYASEIDDLGWRMPDGMDEFLLPVYIDDSPWQAAAYTTIDYQPCGGHYTPYIVVESGSFFDGTWWQDMSAHEFNHASQFNYGQAAEFWWWEATATYMQEYVYPTHNEWVYYVNGYTQQPWLALDTTDQADYGAFLHMYGMAIWNFWIDENYGGLPTIQAMWEYADQRGGYYNASQQDLLEGVGQDFAEVYKGFTAANTVMTYTEQSAFPAINLRRDVDALPAQGDSDTTAPESFGQNYIRFNLPPADKDKPDLEFTFTGDEPANWLVQIVATGTEEIKEVIEIPVEGSAGTGRLENYGDYGQIFLVMSPRKDAGGTFGYSWTADAREALAPEEPLDTGTPAANDGGDSVDVSGSSGCGCDTGSSGGFAGLGVVIGVIAAGRRRRA